MDLNCPYCEAEQEINHDDGFGYQEDVINEMQCSECEKNFVFTTSIIFSYEAAKADCLNGEDHEFKISHTYPREFSKMRCDYERELTGEERISFGIGTEESYFEKLTQK